MFGCLLASYTDVIETADGDGYVYPDVWTEFAKNNLASIFFYAAIVLAVLLLAVGIVVRLKKQEALPNFLKVAVSLACGFSVTVILAMLSLEFLEMQEKGYIFDLVFQPSAVLGATVVLAIAASYVCYLFGEKAFKIGKIVSLSAVGAALIALLVCIGIYYANGSAEENNGATITVGENVGLYVGALVLIGILLFAALFFGRKDKRGFDSKSIAYAAVCIAMSFALSYLRIPGLTLPQGGSVTIASLLPLAVYSYMFGVKKGIFAGFIYGILQIVQDPWLIHPAQILLDYPIAFAGIGLAGLFAHFKPLEKLPQIQFALGAVLGSLFRFVSHVLSGVFAFSEYSTLDNVWAYSLAYNSFVFVDIAIVVVVGVLVFSSKTFVKEVRKFNPQKPQPALNAQESAEESPQE